MDKQRFIELISQPERITPQESDELFDLSKKHSYSAILKVLMAKVSQVNNTPDKKDLITSAAIATADRNNLKKYLESTSWKVTQVPEQPAKKETAPEKTSEKEQTTIIAEPEKPVQQKPKTEEIDKSEEAKTEIRSTVRKSDSDYKTGILSDELIKNIEAYKENRKQFEKLLDQQKPSPKPKKSAPESKADKSAEKEEKSEKPAEVKSKKTGKAKKSVIDSGTESGKSKKTKTTDVENSETDRKAPETDEPGPDKTKESLKFKDPESSEKVHEDQDEINIASIEQSSEKKLAEGYELHEEEDPKLIRKHLKTLEGNIEEDSPEPSKKMKKEEQEEIIEKFIKSQPKIENVKSGSGQKQREDLSLPSVKFSDNIISENLAQIMIKQGKFEKAIDIYKKLIWKFPQKKTYFASQIEELKKKSGK